MFLHFFKHNETELQINISDTKQNNYL